MASDVYYNENNPFAAQWLRNLMINDLIPMGPVDERSIDDIAPTDLDGFTTCHFFAGIGGWPLALRMAGWPDDAPVWTGSCPCQPFSQAGQRQGFADKRHLWPAWHWLIRAKRPDVVMGEQVASPDGLAWFDLVFADMEGLGYTCRAVDIAAASFGAPHVRQRLWWMADADSERCGETRQHNTTIRCAEPAGSVAACRLGGAVEIGWSRFARQETAQRIAVSGGAVDPWRELEWIRCLDGKVRPTQPELFPLAARVPGDVGKLRAYGNAISPPVAAEVIRAFMDARNG